MFTVSRLLESYGVKALFTDREGGSSLPPWDSLNFGHGLGDQNVSQNLSRLCEKTFLPIPHQALQVHGINFLLCIGDGEVHQKEADILLGKGKGMALAVRTADCLPVLLVDPGEQVMAAVHAGWRGTAAQVVKRAVKEMVDIGARPDQIIATMGPAIGECCFEVQGAVAEALQASCDDKVISARDGKLFASLSKANCLQLKSSGLSLGNIEDMSLCTCCNDSPSYYSYRRDNGVTGRQLAVISLS